MDVTKLAAAAITLLLAAPTIASADCVEDSRRVAFDKQNVIRLKSFNCRSGQDTFRVEFHRLNEVAASMTVAKRATEVMRRTFGSPKLIENEVFASYSDLLRRFGQDVQLTGNLRRQLTLSVGVINNDPERQGASATMPARTIRRIGGSHGLEGGDYPAHQEVASLRKRLIPDDWRFYHQIRCPDPANSACLGTFVWRPMQRSDIENYDRNLAEYNRALMRFRSEVRSTEDLLMGPGNPAIFNVLKYLAGDTWPDDLLTISGRRGDACTDEYSIDGWRFEYSARSIHLDVVLIQNTSKRPLQISGLFGRRTDAPRLRRAVEPPAVGGDPIAGLQETLAPGQRLLVPVRIQLTAPDIYSSADERSEATLQAMDLFKRYGHLGYSINKARYIIPPVLPDYNYGAEIAITGLQVNSARVDLARRMVQNFMDLSVSLEGGSCPYLLSWDHRTREWTDHGKVLHRAPNREREYTDTRTVEGFASRFRLEEREAELAHIDHVELVVSLVDGRTLTLTPGHTALAARDGNYVRLQWGDAIEISFALPRDISENEVAESTFNVTGYYERYSSLMARNHPPAADSRWAALLRSDSARTTLLACPIPPRSLPPRQNGSQ